MGTGARWAAALEAGQVGEQELPAPDGAVGAEAGAVERHPDHRALLAVVGQAGRDVRVVVLDAGQVHAVELQRVLGGQVLRVQVVRDHLRFGVEQPPEVGDPVGEGPQGLEVLQIADVVRDERPVPTARQNVFFSSAPQASTGRGQAGGEAERLGRVAAGAAQQRFPARERPHHRVVGPDVDRPVVGEEGVRDACQPRQRVRRRCRRSARRRRFRWSGRWGGRPREQQMVQRGVGKHDPELAVARRDRVRRPARRAGAAAAPPAAARAGQAAARPSRRPRTVPARRARSAAISANGLSSRCLRARSADAAASLPASTARWYPPRPLTASTCPSAEQPGRFRQGVPASSLCRVSSRPEPRPAGRAADRLGVESAVRRVVVLGRALRAHGERRHGGQRPVVGHAGDDGEPGPAVGAVDERVAEPPVRRVGQLGAGSRRRSRCRPRPARGGGRCGRWRRSRTPPPRWATAPPPSPGRSWPAAAPGVPAAQKLAQRTLPRPRPLRTRHRRRCRPSPARPSRVARAYTNGRKPTPARRLPPGRTPGRCWSPGQSAGSCPGQPAPARRGAAIKSLGAIARRARPSRIAMRIRRHWAAMPGWAAPGWRPGHAGRETSMKALRWLSRVRGGTGGAARGCSCSGGGAATSGSGGSSSPGVSASAGPTPDAASPAQAGEIRDEEGDELPCLGRGDAGRVQGLGGLEHDALRRHVRDDVGQPDARQGAGNAGPCVSQGNVRPAEVAEPPDRGLRASYAAST